jgi:hypothetical protein
MRRIVKLTMGVSIGDWIVTPYITNLSGKDLNRCQVTRMFFRPNMFLGYVCLLLDEASKGEVSTFTIIFRKRVPTIICYPSLKQILPLKNFSLERTQITGPQDQ